MAGHARYTALLDACVLHPMAMADALLSLASSGLYAAKWSRTIELEWMASIEKRRPELEGRLGYRRDQMREAVPDWEVGAAAWFRTDVQPADLYPSAVEYLLRPQSNRSGGQLRDRVPSHGGGGT